MTTSNFGIGETSFFTKAMPKEIKKSKNRLVIGIPKEADECEKRLALTPEAVDMIVEAGHQVVLEKEAGIGINYSDAKYAEAGAIIVSTAAEVYQCNIILKIAPPTLDEVKMMKNKASVFSMLQLPSLSIQTIHAMMEKKINAVGYELISNGNKSYPIRNSISEIEGAAAISVASELLSNAHGGKGILMGGIPGVSPTEVIIIGAGLAGTTAARVALGLGATVKVFDNDIDRLREIQQALGQTLFTSVFQPQVLVSAFKSADVVIGAMRYLNCPVRYVISEDVIKTMKKGSLIIDMRINQGGCFETTCFLPEDSPKVYEKSGVLHYCIPNLSSRVGRTTSMALSNIFTPLIIQIGDTGGIQSFTKIDPGFREGIYMYAGKLVNPYVANAFNLPSNDIGLFFATY